MRGPFTVTVTAAGTLAPRNQVDIGAEISGRIDSIGVDFNDRVRKGEALARINTDQLQAQLAQARATLDQSEATFAQNEDTIRRDRALAKTGAVSPQQLVAAEGDYSRARAGIALAAAQVKQDETMLSKATIHSPIDGVVLDRKVSVGQTLVATMQTPVLFTLASDLSQMELRIAIDEADVGQIHSGSPASFIVDAYPGRQFAATLISVHDAPQTIKGAVTYQGVLLVQNPEGLLKPGMTATVSVEASRLQDALLLRNSALKYAPAVGAKRAALSIPASRNGVAWGRVWSLEGRELVAHEVRLGPSDGRQTAILSGDLKPGDQVVVGTKRN
jgi:HlyD family secretion protein